MPLQPAPFSYTNTHAYTHAVSDTVDFVADAANNPEGYTYFYPFTITTGALVIIDSRGVQRTLSAVPAYTIIPIACRRVNSTGTVATFIALVPKQPMN